MKKFFKLFLIMLLLFNLTPAIAETLNVTTASYSIVVDGEKWNPNNPILSINGKTYLPLTEIADLLDVDISWNEKKRQVEITKDEVSEKAQEENDEDDESDEKEKDETEDGDETYSSYLEWLMAWYGIDEDEPEEEFVEEENEFSFSLDWLWSWDDDSQIKVSYDSDGNTDKSEDSDTTSSTSSTAKNYVASKSGSKYHLSSCSSAKKIKSANKTYFSSEANAKSAGYSACSICIK